MPNDKDANGNAKYAGYHGSGEVGDVEDRSNGLPAPTATRQPHAIFRTPWPLCLLAWHKGGRGLKRETPRVNMLNVAWINDSQFLKNEYKYPLVAT